MPSGNVKNGFQAPSERGREHVGMSHAPREGVQLTVKQPERIQSLLLVLADLEKITERVSEDRSHDPGTGGAGTAGTGADGGGTAPQSFRQQAIQSLPPPPVMQRRLITHLEREIRRLEREAKRIAWAAHKGSAYLLTQIYARIRKIQTLIAELLDAAADVIRRLYVRLFIDHQQLI